MMHPPTPQQATFQRIAKSTQPEDGHFTSLDVLHPRAVHTHPRFREASPVQCRVRAGDVLLLPAFWWHEVLSWPLPMHPPADERRAANATTGSTAAGGSGGRAGARGEQPVQSGVNFAVNFWYKPARRTAKCAQGSLLEGRQCELFGEPLMPPRPPDGYATQVPRASDGA